GYAVGPNRWRREPMPEVVTCRVCGRRTCAKEGCTGPEVVRPGSPAPESARPDAASQPPSAWDGPSRIAFLSAMIDAGAPFVPEDGAGWRRVRFGLTLLLLAWGSLAAVVVHEVGRDHTPKDWRLVVTCLVAAHPILLTLAGLIACATAPRRRLARW